MSHIVAASAIGTLMNHGYTELEAKRIRGFLPRRFDLTSASLPVTNIDAWLAYRAVKHYSRFANERGCFMPGDNGNGGYLSMFHYESMKYVTEQFVLTFSTTEFVRHFGDAFYTDMDEQAGKRVIRLNGDGSFVMKNRRLEQLLLEMERRSQEPENSPGSFTYYVNNGVRAEKLYLPKDEKYTPKEIFTMFTHGKMAKEYINNSNGRALVQGLNYHEVAKYLHFLHCLQAQGNEAGKLFVGERFTVLGNYAGRNVYGHAHFPHRLGQVVYFEDQEILTGPSVVRDWPLTNVQYEFGYNATHDMVRLFLGNGAIDAAPVIPLAVKAFFTLEEWRTAIN